MAEDFLRVFLSADNAARKNAEQQLNDLVSGNFLQGLQLLSQGLQLAAPELAEMASVLICRFYLDKEETFKQIPKEALKELVLIGQRQLSQDGKMSYLRRMNDLVVKILLRLEMYDEMMNFILTQSPQTTNMKISLMYFIEMMCEFAFDDELLLKHAQNLNQVFTLYLEDAEPTVKVAALKAMTTFLSSIENNSTLMKFQGAVPTLLQKCIDAIRIDQDSATSALQSLNDLLESHPKFLDKNTEDLLTLFTQLMESSQYSGDLRRAALHGLQTLAHAAQVQVRKSELFKTRTTIALMRMLTEMDNTEWEQDLEDNCLQSQEISAAAQDCLAKLSGDLQVKYLLPVFIKLIVPALGSQDWRDQHAGLVAMAMLSEGASKHFSNELDSIMMAVLPLGASSNTRVVYDVLTCFALLCQEFSPNIQMKYGQQILQLVVAAMQQSASAKLKYRGTSCLVDFCRELVEDTEEAGKVLSPYAQALLEILYQQINENLSKTVTEKESKVAQEALTALSTLAAALKTHFAAFYDTIMPAMMRIMGSLPQAEQYAEIRSLVIECMGFILGSIADSRKDQFIRDASQLMNDLLTYQAALVADDQQHPALFSFYSQVASGMQSAFQEYLPRVFDLVERAIKIDLGFSVKDSLASDSSQSTAKLARFKFDLKLAGLKTLELNTSALEQMIEGTHTLLALVQHCGKSFSPLLQRTAALVMEFISFKNSRDVRETMAKCIYHMMMACSTPQEMAQVFNYVGPNLLLETSKALKGDAVSANNMLEQVSQCVELLRHPLITEQLVQQILTACTEAMALCKSEKKAILKEYADQEQDAELAEQLKGEYEDIDALMESVVNIVAQLQKVYPGVESVVVNNIMPSFYELLVANNSTQDEFLNSVAFFNSVLPKCSPAVFEKGLQQIGQVYIAKSNTTDLEVKQNLLHGMGEFAIKASQTQFSGFMSIVQQLTAAILGEPDIKTTSKINSFETAVATMGKLGLFQAQSDMLGKFIESLPLSQSDAQETHLMLLKQVEAANPALEPIKQQLLVKLTQLRDQDNNNPENEILCDEGRQIIRKLVA